MTLPLRPKSEVWGFERGEKYDVKMAEISAKCRVFRIAPPLLGKAKHHLTPVGMGLGRSDM